MGDLYDRADGVSDAGRLLLIIPSRIETVPAYQRPGEMVDRMTADVVVLDGGPLHWGGAPNKRPAIPHTQVSQIPYRIDAMYLSAVGVVNQCREALKRRAAGQTAGSMVVGRLSIGQAADPQKNPPYFLAVSTPEEKVIARTYWQHFLAAKDPFA